MISSGIRISDAKGHVCIPFSDLLPLIDGNNLNWALLWIDVMPKKEYAESIIKLESKANKSSNGVACSWDFILELAKKSDQEINLLIIASQSVQNLRRYKDDKEMYETCDVVIEMIDGGFWEISSWDSKLIAKLKSQFHDIELLDIDFQKRL
jgi:hypothetical protein